MLAGRSPRCALTIAQPLAAIAFDAVAIEWRGPAPYVFAALPDDLVQAIRDAARLASYGWGCVPVAATANGVAFTTSLIPRDGGYLVPLKAAVRRDAAVAVGDAVALEVRVFAPVAGPARRFYAGEP